MTSLDQSTQEAASFAASSSSMVAYHYWQLESSSSEATAALARDIGDVVARLYGWLGLPAPQVVTPPPEASVFSLTEHRWLPATMADDQTVQIESANNDGRVGFIEARSIGQTIALIVGAQLNRPYTEGAVAELEQAHAQLETAAAPYLGSLWLYGFEINNRRSDLHEVGQSMLSNLNFQSDGGAWSAWRTTSLDLGVAFIGLRADDKRRNRLLAVSDSRFSRRSVRHQYSTDSWAVCRTGLRTTEILRQRSPAPTDLE